MNQKDNEMYFDYLVEGGMISTDPTAYCSGIEVQFCIHDWVKYEGFNEMYDYCSKCDLKDKK
jgi:hypothetical protein